MKKIILIINLTCSLIAFSDTREEERSFDIALAISHSLIKSCIESSHLKFNQTDLLSSLAECKDYLKIRCAKGEFNKDRCNEITNMAKLTKNQASVKISSKELKLKKFTEFLKYSKGLVDPEEADKEAYLVLMDEGKNQKEYSKLIDKIMKVEKKISSYFISKACRLNVDCILLPIGHRRCGGAETYHIASQFTPQLENLQKDLATNSELIKEAQTYSSQMSICSMAPKPIAECKLNQCTPAQ